jgi:hypothetical protein
MRSRLHSPPGALESITREQRLKKLEAIILALMMAPKLSGAVRLRRHHLYAARPSATGIGRTGTPNTVLRKLEAEAGRTIGIAAESMIYRHQDNRMTMGSQSVKLIELLLQISSDYGVKTPEFLSVLAHHPAGHLPAIQNI